MWHFKQADPETLDNINHGQIVVITARWILILTGWVMTFWQPELTAAWQIRIAIALLMTYSCVNFFLTVQWVNRSGVLPKVVYVMSIADLALITALVGTFGPDSVYVFYLPALLALTVTLPRSEAAALTVTVMATFAAIALIRAGDAIDTGEAQSIFVQVVLLAAVAFCGGLYRELEADRRAGRGRIFLVFKQTSMDEAGRTAPDVTESVAEARA